MVKPMKVLYVAVARSRSRCSKRGGRRCDAHGGGDRDRAACDGRSMSSSHTGDARAGLVTRLRARAELREWCRAPPSRARRARCSHGWAGEGGGGGGGEGAATRAAAVTAVLGGDGGGGEGLGGGDGGLGGGGGEGGAVIMQSVPTQ